jgi:hypothetical protein
MEGKAMKRPTTIRLVYLIDGIAVPHRIWKRRQRFGEYAGARFDVEEIRI